MKNFEELEQFINNHEEDWKYRLLHTPFNLKAVKQCLYNENWYCLMYNLYDSIFDNSFEGKVVRECRGTIIEKIPGSPCKVICAPYTKFFNYGEEHAADIDWNSAIIREKIDGWLIKCTIGYSSIEQKNHCAIWFSNGAFLDNIEPGEVDNTLNINGLKCENINQVLFAALKTNNETDFSIIKDVACTTYSSWMDNIPVGTTLMFELTSAWTKICTNYNPYPTLWLHGVRLPNGEEIIPEYAKDKWRIPFQIPQEFKYDFTKAEDVKDFMKGWLGKDHEGVVVCDKNFSRIKIKCEDYLKMKYTYDYADMLDKPKNVWKFYIEGSYDDILAIAPHVKEKIDQMHDEIEVFKQHYLNECKKSQTLYKECNCIRKDFAEKISHLAIDPIIKSLYFKHFMNTSEEVDTAIFNKYMQNLSIRKDGYRVYERLKLACS